jgi:hypothetical protein
LRRNLVREPGYPRENLDRNRQTAHVGSFPEYSIIYIPKSQPALDPRSQPSVSTRPVSSPLAVTRDNTQKLTGDDAVRLLARVQLVVPQETVLVRRVGAVHIAASEAGDIERGGAVEVLRRVVVDVGDLKRGEKSSAVVDFQQMRASLGTSNSPSHAYP